MSISRITKGIAEIIRADTFAAAEQIRNKDVDFILPVGVPPDLVAMVKTATALVLRCFKGKIRVHLHNDSVELRRAIAAEAEKLKEPERVDFASVEMGAWRLGFGCVVAGAICGDCSGWTARINGAFESRSPAAGCAMTFAVACMVAKLFNAAVLGRAANASEAWDFCLLDFTARSAVPIPATQGVDLGTVALVGAGAIGTAIGYVILHSKAKMELLVIDPQGFEEPNLETCILADFAALVGLARKAPFLVGLLRASGISAHGECRRIAGPQDSILLENWDAFLCGVDNPETRRILDATRTRVLLNGGLGDSKDDAGFVLWTKHGAVGPKLSELYAPTVVPLGDADGHVPNEFKDKCSRMLYQNVALSIPFTALAVGSLLVASLYQRALGVPVDCNYLQLDVLGKQSRMTKK